MFHSSWQKWPMRSRLYVSDPMWLYRSGRQSIMMSQSVGSPSSSNTSVSCEENPPSVEIVDVQSPSASPLDDLSRFSPPYRHDCIQETQCYRDTGFNVDYNHPRTNQTYFTPSQEQSFQTSSCRFQKAAPREHQSLWWRSFISLQEFLKWPKVYPTFNRT